MSYRDETQAAVNRLVALEVELASRRSTKLALRSYRASLRQEVERLEHALMWYQNGERYGWHSFAERDDLTPARAPEVRLPGTAQLARAYSRLDRSTITQRTVEVERCLAHGDWRTGRLRFEIDELRTRAGELRHVVDCYALRYPDHPPPPAANPGTDLALGITASVGGLWVALMLLTILVM